MTLRKAGIELDLKNEAAYKAGLRDIARATKALGLESQIAMAKLGNSAKPMDVYSTKVKYMGKRYDLLQQNMSSYQKTLDKLPKTQKTIKEALDKEIQSYKDASKHLEKLDGQYQTSINTRDELYGKMKATNILYRQSRDETERLRKSLKKVKDANDPLVKQYAESRQATEKLAKEHAVLTEKHAEAITTSRKLKNSFYDQKQAVSELESSIKSLEKTHNNNAERERKLTDLSKKSQLDSLLLRNQMMDENREWLKQGGRFINPVQTMDKWGKRLQNAGNIMMETGQRMTQFLTVPLVTGFGLATREAINFNSQIEALGPLMSGGEKITLAMRMQMNQLGRDSRRFAVEYGKSTSELNEGLAELVRTGFDATQSAKIMPHILDASIASGEDFNAVMSTGVEGLMQFGLQAGDVSKNMQRVTDSYTHVANATKSGITDIGMAMSYVGSTAHGLGMSLEETTSIIGILTNHGLEASMAGTGLRAVLSNLANPTRNASSAMKALGIDTEAFKRGAIGMPEIIDSIRKNTAGLTQEQRTALMLQAFGRVGANAMNALYAEGAENLRELTRETENATGVTAKMAEQMRKTPKFQLQQAISQIRDLGISIGNILLPKVNEWLTKAKGWITSFQQMGDSTKSAIVNTGLLVATLGPLLAIGGAIVSGAGKILSLGSGIVKLIGFLTSPMMILTGETTALSAGLEILATGLGLLASPAGLAIAGIALLTGALTNLNKESRATKLAMQEFPNIDGITGKQAESIRNTSDAYDELSTKIGLAAQTTEQYGDDVSNAVSRIVDEIQRLNSVDPSVEESLKEMPLEVQVAGEKYLKNFKKIGDHRINRAQQIEDSVKAIYERASNDRRELSEAELAYVESTARELAVIQSASLAKNSEQGKQIYKTLTADISQMQRKQLNDHKNMISDSLRDAKELYDKNKKAIEEDFNNDSTMLSTLDKNFKELTRALAVQMGVTMSKAKGEYKKVSTETLQEISEQIREMTGYTLDDLGISFDELKKAINLGAEGLKAGTNGAFKGLFDGFTTAPERIMEAVNKTKLAMLGFMDSIKKPLSQLTGEELVDFGNKLKEAGVSWNDLRWITSKDAVGYVDAKTQDFFRKVMEANVEWRKEWEDKRVTIDVDDEKLMESIKTIEDFNKLQLADKLAFLEASGREQLEALLDSCGAFDNMPDGITKEAILDAQGSEKVEMLMWALNDFKAFDNETVTILVEKSSAENNLKDLFTQFGLLDNETFKRRYINLDSNAPDFLSQVANVISTLDNIPPETKAKIIAELQNIEQTKMGLDVLQGAVQGLDESNPTIDVDADTTNAENSLTNMNFKVEELDGKESRVLVTADGRRFIEVMTDAGTQLQELDGKHAGIFIDATDNASPKAGEVKGAIESIPENKNTSLTTSLGSAIANAVGALTLSVYKKQIESIPDSKTTTIEAKMNNVTNATSQVKKLNETMGKMKDKTVTATTNVPNIIGNTANVKRWNTTLENSRNKSSTFTTSVPGIFSNIQSAKSWIMTLGRAYDKTSTLTTVHNTVHRTTYQSSGFGGGYRGGRAVRAGRHATGGNIRWGGAFAGGGFVPVDYMGIVGEAGPELFHVHRGGVKITPLSSREKMRGVEGAIANYMKNKDSGSNPITININIDAPSFRNEDDMNRLVGKVKDSISRELKRQQITRRGSAVGV